MTIQLKLAAPLSPALLPSSLLHDHQLWVIVNSIAGLTWLPSACSVDLTGGRLVGRGLVDDGATPPRKLYPYNS